MTINFQPFPILKGQNVVLKELTKEHATALFNYQSNKDNFPYVQMAVYTDINQAHEYISKMNAGVSENKWIIWAICLSDNTIVGTLSIWNINDNKAEFGYGLFPKYRRQGYMQEALTLAIEYGFNIMNLEVLEAYTSSINKPSISFLKKMDFEFVKTFEDEYSNGALMDHFVTRKD